MPVLKLCLSSLTHHLCLRCCRCRQVSPPQVGLCLWLLRCRQPVALCLSLTFHCLCTRADLLTSLCDGPPDTRSRLATVPPGSETQLRAHTERTTTNRTGSSSTANSMTTIAKDGRRQNHVPVQAEAPAGQGAAGAIAHTNPGGRALLALLESIGPEMVRHGTLPTCLCFLPPHIFGPLVPPRAAHRHGCCARAPGGLAAEASTA